MIKELLRNVDYLLLSVVIALMVVGVVMIHSASTSEYLGISGVWTKQVIWVALSILIMLAIVPIPQRFFYLFAYVFYVIGIVLLVFTQFFGTTGGGSERWLLLGPFRLQPSEFMKIATILALSRYLSVKKNRPDTYLKCIPPFIIILVPMILVQMQPDLGTALVFAAIILPMLYWAGLDTVRLFFLVAPVLSAIFTAPFIPFVNPIVWVAFMFAVLGVLYYARASFVGIGLNLGTNIFAGIAMPYVFNRLEPYQQKRITTIFNPEADPLGSGYQLIHSKIAVGSGGIFGKGANNGDFTKLGFLPHSHTDFIFSVVCEELGFIGALLVISGLLIIVFRAAMIAVEVKSPFLSIASVGIATSFAFHMFVNIGMVIGIMPVTGLPLPFLSYGGSSCLTNALMIGLLLNFRVNRHEF